MVHSGQFGPQTDLGPDPGVCLQQTVAGFGSVSDVVITVSIEASL